MSVSLSFDTSLPSEARAIVWRIFGNGESPLKDRSSFELIRPIVERHLAPAQQLQVAREIQGWFEWRGNRHRLRAEVTDRVAEVILEGIAAGPSETAAWAIGSINAESAAKLIRSSWSASAIDSLVSNILESLVKACDRDKVLDLRRGEIGLNFDCAGGEIAAKDIVRDGRIATFQHLQNQGLGLVIRGLHSAIANLTDLLSSLRPDLFRCMVKQLNHPVVQAAVARSAIGTARLTNHRATLDWIGADSCSSQVALAIVHSLETVNALDSDLRFAGGHDVAGHRWETELRPSYDDLDAAAADLLGGLVARLSQLDPLVSAQWIGELLAQAHLSLHLQGTAKPLRICQLEKSCIRALKRLVHRSWSGGLIESLSAGLRGDRRKTWRRYLARLAWSLRKSDPAHAAGIAKTALRGHEAHIEEVLAQDQFFLWWDKWDHREWIDGLGTCLAVAGQGLELRRWVEERCRMLPLTAWDADAKESYDQFITAEKVARHWFLVAFHAIPRLGELDAKVDPATILSLTTLFWDHCEFVRPYVSSRAELSVSAEYVARCAVEFGDADDGWLLEQARRPVVGARILWALIDQRRLRIERDTDSGASPQRDELFASELVSLASDHFGDGRTAGLDSLAYWGHLWLLLSAVDQAERAASAILAFSRRPLDRSHNILVLELLALVARKRSLAHQHPVRDQVQSLYRQLWSAFTPKEEQLDRERVDALLKDMPNGSLAI